MRDPRKNSAYASGMRGQEKPKVASAHGGTWGQQKEGTKGGQNKQGPDTMVGDPDGVSHRDPVYRSGMRGLEKGKQKPASSTASGTGANYGQTTSGSPQPAGNKQKADTFIGNPDGEPGWAGSKAKGVKNGVGDAAIRSKPAGAYKLGIPGNNTEQASQTKTPATCSNCGHPTSNTAHPTPSLTKKKGSGQAV